MLELVRCTQVTEWDRLVDTQPRATVFHRSPWLALVERISGAQLHPFLIHQQSDIVGLLPAFFFRRGPFRIAASPPPLAATPYLSPLVDDALLGEALQAYGRVAKDLKASYLELRSECVIPKCVLSDAHLEDETRATFLLDLRPGPDALWQNSFTSGCRRAIRKAQQSAVVVQEERLDDVLDRYYELAVGVYAKSNRPPPLSRANYAAVAEVARRSECIKVFVARLGDVVAAAGIFPFGNGAIYYLDGVSDPAAQQARPNNLLHWEVIRWACAAGLQRYDMVGAGIAGVARFKQGFGPAEVPYTYAFRSLTPLASLARSTYALLAPAARAAQYALSRRGKRSQAADPD